MRIVKNILIVILVLAVFACVLGGIAGMSVYSVYKDPGSAAQKTVDNEYLETLHSSIIESVKKTMMLISLDYSVFEDNVSFDEIDSLAVESLEVIYSRIFYSTDKALPDYKSDKLLNAIQTSIDEYAKENGLTVEEGSADEVYKYICEDIQAHVHVLGEQYLSKISFIHKYFAVLKYSYVPFAAAFICGALIFIIKRRNIFSALNIVSTACYAGSFLPFVISVIMLSRNYISGIALTDGVLRELFIRIYNMVLLSIRNVSMIIFIPSAVILVVDIFLLAAYGSRNTKNNNIDNSTDNKLPAE